MKINGIKVDISADCLKKSKFANEPLIPANKSQFWAKILDPMIYRMIENNFSYVRIKNKNNYYLGNPHYANLLYGSHYCFHDGQVAYYICRKGFDANFYMMIEELYKFPILSKIGGFSVEKNSSLALNSINYAAELLKNRDNMVWIFPQGKVLPPDFRPIKFESGLSSIVNKVKHVNLIPVAVKFVFVRQYKPEIFAEVGEPLIIDNGVSDKKAFTKQLEDNFTYMNDVQNKNISQGEFDGYESLYENALPLFKRIEPYVKRFVFDKRYL